MENFSTTRYNAMQNYPNMSYCAIENTSNALQQVIELIDENGGSVEEYLAECTKYEQSAWQKLVNAAYTIVQYAEMEEENV